MAKSQDARPFVDLKKDAEAFQVKFSEDIKECIDVLDSKITALICDPDSLGNPGKSIKQNALLEFSKAKYDIFISVKSLINRKEKEWLDYISEMKKYFVENVEIFLAATKLEVKLPSSEYQSSHSFRKSPGKRKSISSVLNDIAKSIPVLSSPLCNKETVTSNDISNVGNEVQSNRSGRLSAKFNIAPGASAIISLNDNNMESSDSSENGSRAVEDKVQFNRRGRVSIKLNNPPRVASSLSQKDFTISSDSSENESRTVEDNGNFKRRGGQSTTSVKLPYSTMQILEETDNSELNINDNYQEIEDVEMDTEEADFGMQRKNACTSQIQKDVTVSRSARGRRGKQTVQSDTLDHGADSLQSKKLPRRISKLKETENHCFEETGEPETVETIISESKGRRGKQKTRNAVNNSLENQAVENMNVVHEEEPTVEVVSARSRRGRSTAVKDSDNISVDSARTNARGRKNKIVDKTHQSGTVVSVMTTARGRKTKTADKTHESVPSFQETNLSSSDEHSQPDIQFSVSRPSKSVARRKTLLPNLGDISGPDIIQGNPRTKSKRKTVCGFTELESVVPPKRLKVSTKKNVSSIEVEDAADNLLESDENYSEWMALKNIDGRIPTLPAIYEVKVWRAKKTAYIGSCDSLRQKLTLYKLRQNSGHKHLDKFLERNFDDIQIRFEVVPSEDVAKSEVKKRVKHFIEQYKTTPAYN